MVRVKLPVEEKKSEIVFVGLRPGEKKRLEEVSAVHGRSQGALLRDAFLHLYGETKHVAPGQGKRSRRA